MCKCFFAFNWFFKTINHENFRKLLLITRLNLILIYCIKFQNMIFSNYENVCAQIKTNLKHIRRVFIALNKWENSQKISYLKIFVYWINDNFQYREHFIEFTSMNIQHIEMHLMIELMRILNFYEIREKLFDVVIDNVDNNKTLKNELKKTMNRRDFRWNKKQNFIFCIIYIFNLTTQNFINVFDFEIFDKTKINELNEK